MNSMITGSSLGHRQAFSLARVSGNSAKTARTAAQVRRATALGPRRSARQQAVLLLHLLISMRDCRIYRFDNSNV
ncbi:MAG: hypothetical protein WA692_25975 [Paraburkholderia caledonica]|nr:hypothetical protein [Paraburkholderia strydomiana]